MKVALFTNSNYSINKRNKNRTITHTPSFAGSSAKVPKEINAAFTFLRKQIEAGMQGKSQNIFAVPVVKKNDEVALVMLEKKKKKLAVVLSLRQHKRRQKSRSNSLQRGQRYY